MKSKPSIRNYICDINFHSTIHFGKHPFQINSLQLITLSQIISHTYHHIPPSFHQITIPTKNIHFSDNTIFTSVTNQSKHQWNFPNNSHSRFSKNPNSHSLDLPTLGRLLRTLPRIKKRDQSHCRCKRKIQKRTQGFSNM